VAGCQGEVGLQKTVPGGERGRRSPRLETSILKIAFFTPGLAETLIASEIGNLHVALCLGLVSLTLRCIAEEENFHSSQLLRSIDAAPVIATIEGPLMPFRLLSLLLTSIFHLSDTLVFKFSLLRLSRITFPAPSDLPAMAMYLHRLIHPCPSVNLLLTLCSKSPRSP